MRNGRNLKIYTTYYSKFIKENKWGYFTKIMGFRPKNDIPKEKQDEFISERQRFLSKLKEENITENLSPYLKTFFNMRKSFIIKIFIYFHL